MIEVERTPGRQGHTHSNHTVEAVNRGDGDTTTGTQSAKSLVGHARMKRSRDGRGAVSHIAMQYSAMAAARCRTGRRK